MQTNSKNIFTNAFPNIICPIPYQQPNSPFAASNQVLQMTPA
jgi:hypothetical protein